MQALKIGGKCPNAAVTDKCGSDFCSACPFRRHHHEFIASYGPTFIYNNRDFIYCDFNEKDIQLPRGVKLKREGKGAKKKMWVELEDLPKCYRTFPIGGRQKPIYHSPSK